jgi:para-aminobenzoate synthetase component 1
VSGLPDPSPFLAALPRECTSVAVRRGRSWVIGADPDEVVVARGAPAFGALNSLSPGWWAGFLSYDLGREVEATPNLALDDRGIPDLVLARFDSRLVLDDESATAWVEGDGQGRALLERMSREPCPSREQPTEATTWSSSLERADYCDGVATIRELIGAGECYQVNLTRRRHRCEALEPIALLGSLTRHNPAPHACLLRLPEVTVVSASPERFLAWRGHEVETRPIKGTARRASVLAASEKDRAENVMIVDLARNDFGRVCEPGSIHVPALCAVESHPGLHHLVSTVRGRRRDDVGLAELVRAVLPPASVTGAPKPRVLRVIEDLEPVRRGVYCGALGWFDTRLGVGDLAVAIRSFTITEHGTDLGVGAGITYDSDPSSEWDETELKAARLLVAAEQHSHVGVTA